MPVWLRLAAFAIAWIITWRLIWFWIAERRRRPRSLLVAIVASGLLLTSLTAGISAADSGVVVVAEVMPRKGNGFVYEGAFTTALHAGAEFAVLEIRGEWTHAEFANGDRAWLPAPAIQLVAE